MTARTPLRHRRTGRGLAALVGVALALALLAPASPAAADDYPSWTDVQNARSNQAATQALVTRIESALDQAQAQSATLSATALQKAAVAEQARAAADDATARATALDTQSAAADAELARTHAQLGAIAAGLYRTRADSALIARLLTSAEPATLLTRLGLMDRLSTTWAAQVAEAQRTAATAASLREQAVVAETARRDAAQTAARTASEAQAAADGEATTVAALSGQVSTMYAQLAALKNTTADTERQYRLGQQVAQAAAAQAAAQAAAAASGGAGSGGSGAGSSGSGGSGSGGSGGSGGGDSGGSAPTGVTVDPAGAQAYARSAMASRYGWGGDQFSCLLLLWNRESGWRADAYNPDSGAYGIPQSLPGDKMASAGADWRTNGNTQVDWGLAYISDVYGSPCGAWGHSQATGWY
ncbi:hypothetical protein [Microbacterium sp. SORGH_AS_0888]|uniref:coiled-coil domain-containing protein n=1 Tax=Microbacterium sp. SORGH_AS_0888 TaxID=3041791 RepID=UPI00277DB29C|nr:hypothetical protein [Microbacterium sp. SORGH_AS_0888]MDQ1129111.1 putative membrane protein YgcG [Microbacterium sp. SORGH_AS_0888]